MLEKNFVDLSGTVQEPPPSQELSFLNQLHSLFIGGGIVQESRLLWLIHTKPAVSMISVIV